MTQDRFNPLPQPTVPKSFSLRRSSAVGLLIAAAVCAPYPAQAQAPAQYKVIGADGKVTYTDRLPATIQGKVTALAARGGVAAGDAVLPLELRQVVARYPVTLYVMAQGCEPCEAARQLLRQRGIPLTEKQLQSAADVDALERLTGGRDAPVLSIGTQTLRGLAPEVWNSYLDAAGYPRTSRLPASYEYPPATPLVERSDADVRPASTRPASPPSSPSPTSPTTPSGTPNRSDIRF